MRMRSLMAAASFALIGAPTLAQQHQEDGASAASEVPPATIDTDEDGTMDAWDRDGDGRADVWDTDGDGQPDAVDNDGDGAPDQMADEAAPESR